ncbi:MAG: PepSY domain-containing protein [Chloroflexota bacterium]
MKWQNITLAATLGTLFVFGGVANTYAQSETIGKDRAAAIAQERMNGAIPIEIDFDRAKGQDAYEVAFANGTDVYVGKRTGDVLKVERYNDTDRSDRRVARVAAQTPDRIGFSQAAITSQQAAGGDVVGVELGLENGQLVYEVDLTGDTYVYVWAVSGEIYEIEQDDWDYDDWE